jgi:carboxyl-terminal processing protease
VRGALVILLGVGLTLPLAGQTPGDSAHSAQLEQIIHLIATRYRLPLSSDSLYTAALNGVIKTLDPYSTYYDPQTLKDFNEALSGSLAGIGVVVGFDSTPPRYWVNGVIANSPALAAGIQPHDTIISVENHSIDSLSLFEVLGLIKGPPGSIVHLSVHRAGRTRPVEFAIKRATIQFASVRGNCRQNGDWQYLIDPATRIAYVRINDFARNTPPELDSALVAVNRVKATGLVLDLRGNGGGLVRSAILMADQLLDSGTIVSFKERGQPDTTVRATPGVVTDVPVVVLVNEITKSASELFVASLQDNRRATVMGTRTFGKGVYQEIVVLPDSGGLRLTMGAYIRPSGHPIERHTSDADSTLGGVYPDSGMSVPLTEAEYNQWEQTAVDRESAANLAGGLACPIPVGDDRVLARAIEVLTAPHH